MFIFQSKFNDPPYLNRITEKSGTSKINQWDFQISKVGSLDFLNLKVNGSPGILTKLGSNDPSMALFKNCSNGSGPQHI